MTQSAKKIVWMENYFKVNTEGELVLICCNQLRVAQKRQNEMVMDLPNKNEKR